MAKVDHTPVLLHRNPLLPFLGASAALGLGLWLRAADVLIVAAPLMALSAALFAWALRRYFVPHVRVADGEVILRSEWGKVVARVAYDKLTELRVRDQEISVGGTENVVSIATAWIAPAELEQMAAAFSAAAAWEEARGTSAKRSRKKVIRQSELTAAMADEILPRSWGERLRSLSPEKFFLASWLRIDAQAATSAAKLRELGVKWDWRPLLAMVVGAVCLAIMEYFGHHRGMGNGFEAFLDWTAAYHHDGSPANVFAEIETSERWRELWGYGWWSLWRFLGYFVIPVLFIKFVFRERIVDHGLETKGFFEHAWIYGLGYAVVFVCVLGVTAFDPHFRTYYPFYNLCRRSWLDFGIWECLYALQFFSLEFFFRGFWLKSMKNSMGSQAIFAMMVPYCMIHFGKPFLETMGAIIAGIFLGTLSMKTRSIWSGFLLHVSVAITMDLVALIVTGGLPTDWLPQ